MLPGDLGPGLPAGAPSGLGDSNLFWVALLALVISAPLSLVLLRKQRDDMSVQVSAKVEHARSGSPPTAARRTASDRRRPTVSV
ncbi:DUF4229 domain-containing protein [Streptomyces sp. M19]